MPCKGIKILISLFDLMTVVIREKFSCGVENFLEKEEPEIKDGPI